jgi:hypothetical protein
MWDLVRHASARQNGGLPSFIASSRQKNNQYKHRQEAQNKSGLNQPPAEEVEMTFLARVRALKEKDLEGPVEGEHVPSPPPT